ncbi:hypothetical protein POM88_011315 [Heracleum sosnowskyi]|uniref:Uncharacterized protein n=1 Tax=Heracleum sosnowskyi TaxID=360622 RepID=A0AAD8IU93_9APIA|nr:hypothetical protein POM88_011315 [Heracleum sosnowskyi]
MECENIFRSHVTSLQQAITRLPSRLDFQASDIRSGTLPIFWVPSVSSFRLKVPSPALERSTKVKDARNARVIVETEKLLLMLVLVGTFMLIADGVVTPTIPPNCSDVHCWLVEHWSSSNETRMSKWRIPCVFHFLYR